MTTAVKTQQKVLAWHFMADKNGVPALRNGEAAPSIGATLRHDGNLEICSSGLHASERLIDALQYAPGPWLARVELSGQMIRQNDKLVATKRRILAVKNVERELHEFAVMCAVNALERTGETDERCWQAVDIKLAWLEGMANDEDLAAAWAAARAAAWAAARAAAWDAAWDAAMAAAWAAARAAAMDAAWDAENIILTDMMTAALGLKEAHRAG